MKYEIRLLDITLLMVNTENPRFEMVGNQREAIALMFNNQKEKLVKLAQDIIDNGVNPSDLIIVTPHAKYDGKYNVLEGNRRVTALKLLNNPDLIPEKKKNILNKFRNLSKQFKANPITKLNCVIFSDEKDAKLFAFQTILLIESILGVRMSFSLKKETIVAVIS